MLRDCVRYAAGNEMPGKVSESFLYGQYIKVNMTLEWIHFAALFAAIIVFAVGMIVANSKKKEE